MEVSYSNFNNLKHDDFNKIIDYNRKQRGAYLDLSSPNGEVVLMEIQEIKFKLIDNSERIIKIISDFGTSEKLVTKENKKRFYIDRLFGVDGLIVKEGRNDYIYVGGINENTGTPTRFKKNSEGKTYNELVDEWLRKKIYPNLYFGNDGVPIDMFEMEYHLHGGGEEPKDIFSNGLFSRFGLSFESTFAPINNFLNNSYFLFGNMKAMGRLYEKNHHKGRYVYITRVPTMYTGVKENNGQKYPPIPTIKVLNDHDAIIIPEIIYGCYDSLTDTIIKNPNYKPKYNPNGLSYAFEVTFRYNNPETEMGFFMKSRELYSYDQLLSYDEKNGTFDAFCKYYGIDQDERKKVK